jgi:sortase A
LGSATGGVSKEKRAMTSITTSRSLRPKPKQFLLCWSRFFFLAGVIALGYVAVTLIDTELYQTKATRQFEEALSAPKVDVPAGARIPSVVKSGAPLGRIEISSLGVGAMIVEGVDDKTLRRAVGHIPGTAVPGQPGNVALAGHRDTFFRALRNIHKDDEITLETLDGSYRYRVDRIQIVLPGDVQLLKSSSQPTLTLVTCYPFSFVGSAPQRFIVQAHRI